MTAFEMYPLQIACGTDQLAGIVHKGAPDNRRGVIIVVAGGPQYRAGAHRQFVSLARRLVDAGHCVLRFDLRGMGDSSGEHRGYEHSQPDIRAAIDAFLRAESHLAEIVLFGECESASGILFYAYSDTRVKGAVLVNPWVRTEEGQAQAYVKHYYLSRLGSASFWDKVRRGQFNPVTAGISLAQMLAKTARGWIKAKMLRVEEVGDDIGHLALPLRTAIGFRRFRGNILLLMSGRDIIAREFDEVTGQFDAWKGLLDDPRVLRIDLEGADHTFSNPVAKKRAQDSVLQWIASW